MPHEVGNTFAPPPTAFPPTPRRVRWQRFPYGILLLLLFFTVIGIIIFWISFGRLALGLVGQWRGVTVQGQIVEKELSGKGRRNRAIVYAFRLDDEDHTVKVYVDDASFERVKVGEAVQVRVWPVWPDASATIDEPTLARSWNDVCFFGFVTVWNGALISFSFFLARLAWNNRNLARFGMATIGSVTDKRVGHHKGPVFIINYRFRRSDGAECDARMDVPKADFDALQVGQPITVLFDSAQPERNVIYRCSDFRVVGVE